MTRSTPGYGGLRPSWGQSLLRSCLAAHSFPPPPPATCCPRSERGECRCVCARTPSTCCIGRPYRNRQSPKRAKPHHAGGGGGKECVARYERSNDWPQGGAVYPEARLGVGSAPPNP